MDPKVAAIFGIAPPTLGAASPPTPAAPTGTPTPRDPKPIDPFFEMLAKQRPAAAPVSAAPAPAPFSVPDIFKAKPTSTIDVQTAAAQALDRAGWFNNPDGSVSEEERQRALGAINRPQISAPGPTGLFKGIAKVGKKAQQKPRVVKAGATSLKDLFKLDAEPEIHPNSKIADAQRRAGVRDSFELKRILQIERRPPPIDAAKDLTDEFKRPEGTMTLWNRQSAALQEARLADGLFGPIGVGQGKTLVSLLMPAAMKAKQAVLLVPPALRAQLVNIDVPRLAKHWKIPLERIRVVAYSQLSSASSADILEEIKPDLIVADEAHNLRHRTAARTKRFLRYMKEHPECRFVGLSGTMTRRSLHDYGHLAELALKKNSPVPKDWGTLNEWAEALDVSDEPMAPGALLQLCNDDEMEEIVKVDPAGAMSGRPEGSVEVQEIVRGAFRRRLIETPGVVATDENAIGNSLTITAVRPMIPAEVMRKIQDVRSKWEIDGDELVDALSVARVTRQLAAGFRYRWVWPNGVVDEEWLEARKAWNKEVREILKLSRKGLDSPMLIANACERGDFKSYSYEEWRKVKGRPEPPREAVWTSDFLVQEALKWAKDVKKTAPGIIWYSWSCIGEKIAELGQLPFFGPGRKASEALTQVDVKKTPVIVCSIAAHSTGKNLQQFCRNLVTTPPSGGVEWEQMIARTHRPGQLADEVSVDVYVHTVETEGAFRNAVRDAGYIQATQGQPQKLLYAEKIGFPADAFNFGSSDKDVSLEIEGIEWGESTLITQLKASVEAAKAGKLEEAKARPLDAAPWV